MEIAQKVVFSDAEIIYSLPRSWVYGAIPPGASVFEETTRVVPDGTVGIAQAGSTVEFVYDADIRSLIVSVDGCEQVITEDLPMGLQLFPLLCGWGVTLASR